MKNITILAYLIFILSVFIPVYMYKSSNGCQLHSEFKLSRQEFETVWGVVYILNGLSIALVITNNDVNQVYWMTLFSIIINSLINFGLIYKLLYTPRVAYVKYLLLINVLFLSIQVFGSYYIQPMAGILLAPVLVWYIYLLSQFKN